jgi:hypothetical protein
MEYHVIVEKPVSRAIGRFIGQHRTLVVRLLAGMRDDLAHRADTYRGQRDPEDPDLFRYALLLAEGDQWHTFYFRVNDARAQGYLFVEAVDYEARPAL